MKITKSVIFKKAWEIRRKQATKMGCKVSMVSMSVCLKMVYFAVKKINEREEEERKTKEQSFISSNIVSALVTELFQRCVDSYSLSRIFFDESYGVDYNRYTHFYVNGVAGYEMYSFADKMRNGEDIRAEFAKKLIENCFKYCFTAKGLLFSIIYNNDNISAIYRNAVKTISYKALGGAILRYLANKYKRATKQR